LGINPNKYYDQISVYKAELHTRKVVVIKWAMKKSIFLFFLV
jgi:hypothetical protein